MTSARSEIVDSENVGVYHCISRCVRRAFLCGDDPLSGKSFEHRKQWVELRLCTLVEVFAIELVAYAVMSNHVHSLTRTRPDLANSWSAEEVARRWRTLFPLRRVKGKAAEPTEEQIQAIVSQPKTVARYRERLASISWFNRCLNEYIARRANLEDECTGRFWEGRFKCQRAYDVAGILACATYVDLNPIRAGLAKTPEKSAHTSIQDRIIARQKQGRQRRVVRTKVPLVAISEITHKLLSLEDYIKLVDLTGRLIAQGKANIPQELAPILERLAIAGEHWVESTTNFKQHFRRIVGSAAMLERAAAKANKCWFHGVRAARRLFPASGV